MMTPENICPECSEPMERINAPRSLSFSIPFTSIRVDVHVFGIGGHDWLCLWCLNDAEQSIIDAAGREAYDAGLEAGAERALREGRYPTW